MGASKIMDADKYKPTKAPIYISDALWLWQIAVSADGKWLLTFAVHVQNGNSFKLYRVDGTKLIEMRPFHFLDEAYRVFTLASSGADDAEVKNTLASHDQPVGEPVPLLQIRSRRPTSRMQVNRVRSKQDDFTNYL